MKCILGDGNIFVKRIMDSSLKALYLKEGCDCVVDFLTGIKTSEDKLGVVSERLRCVCQIYPVFYVNQLKSDYELVECRNEIYHVLFSRWNSLGFNRYHAKDPFNCASFNRYISNEGLLECDYVVLLVEYTTVE